LSLSLLIIAVAEKQNVRLPPIVAGLQPTLFWPSNLLMIILKSSREYCVFDESVE